MLKVGEHIGETWAVVGTLGAGGAGSVYLCERSGTGETAAVKVLRALHPGILARLEVRAEREAKVLSGLDHPGIVRVVDWGTDAERKAFYLSMEAIEGRELGPADFRGDNGVDPQRVHDIFAKLVDALEYAHERELAHRDLKLQNVLLRHDGQPVLVDWGSVYVEDGERLTRFDDSGALGRTDLYAPPEAILSPAGANPFLWDVYALGVMLYIALTGDLDPYSGTVDSQEMVVVKTAGPLDPGPDHHEQMRGLVKAATAPMPRGRPRSMKTFRRLLMAVPTTPPGEGTAAETLFHTTVPDEVPQPGGPLTQATTLPESPDPATPATPAPVSAPARRPAQPTFAPPPAREDAVQAGATLGSPRLLRGVALAALLLLVGGGSAWYASTTTRASTESDSVDVAAAVVPEARAPVPEELREPAVEPTPTEDPTPAPDHTVPAPAVRGQGTPAEPVPSVAAVLDPSPAPADPPPTDVMVDPDSAESLDPPAGRSPEERARVSRLITVAENTPDRMVARLAQDPDAVAQLVDDLGVKGSDAGATRIANRTYRRLLLGMRGAPADGARIARAAASKGRLDAFVTLSRHGQGGDFQLPVLQVIAKNAPGRIRAPESVRDCRILVEYVDLIGRPSITGSNPWIAASCRACSSIEGAPTGKCGAIDGP